ncbi:type II secretion system F family protein [Desulfuromonas thiophila]|uniref:MSHA biogenesis protein MshG n=1 Tax=Desulfuromonas thiophila TaxID=57664 RepID=A0A1G6ZKQ3_9BACT|nr:type II secretion system F family protein [Desulfuromonas thiophila]SDE03091.1 MSHA biogenesis protein MshG [Desulfuromonas thiophila]
MPLYHYSARRAGQLVQGEIELASPAAVAAQLVENGLTPVRIAEAASRAGRTERSATGGLFQRRVRSEDLILFCRQMYALTRAGVPMLRALRGLMESSRNPRLRQALQGVIDGLESGRELSSALAAFPEVFPPLLTRMVQVGENSGNLEQAFEQLAQYLEFEKQTREQIKAALRYPTFVIVAIAIAISILTLFVIPAFEKVFASFGAQLPLATRIIMAVSHFARDWWPYIAGGLLLGSLLLRRYLRTVSGERLWDRLKLRLPLVGSILRRATLARFARAFAMGYGSGVPLVQALAYTARAIDNRYLGEKLEGMRNQLERGETLTRSAAASAIFTPLVLQMLAVGEESGSVDSMLLEVAGFYEREVAYELKNLTSAIEPVLIIIIGAMVLVLALGVFLPMWNLSSAMRG